MLACSVPLVVKEASAFLWRILAIKFLLLICCSAINVASNLLLQQEILVFPLHILLTSMPVGGCWLGFCLSFSYFGTQNVFTDFYRDVERKKVQLGPVWNWTKKPGW